MLLSKCTFQYTGYIYTAYTWEVVVDWGNYPPEFEGMLSYCNTENKMMNLDTERDKIYNISTMTILYDLLDFG